MILVLNHINPENILIQRSKWYKRNVNNIILTIFYKCDPKNYSFFNERDLFPTELHYYLNIKYKVLF